MYPNAWSASEVAGGASSLFVTDGSICSRLFGLGPEPLGMRDKAALLVDEA